MKGFEIFFEAIRSQLTSQLDVIVAVVHFMVVHESEFVCVGIGDKFTESDNVSNGTELLPTGWNADQTVFTLKYLTRNSVVHHQDTTTSSGGGSSDEPLKLLLKIVTAGDQAIITALPLNSSNTVHSMSIKPGDYVSTSGWKDSYSTTFLTNQSLDTLVELLRREMSIHTLIPRTQTDSAGAQQQQQQQQPRRDPLIDDDPLAIPPPHHRYPGDARPHPYADPLFPRIGGADLDPLQRGIGGGMLYDPFSRGGIGGHGLIDPLNPYGPRPGSIPPGSRYDPVGPPIRGDPRRSNRPPNPDHFPPPGGYDPFI